MAFSFGIPLSGEPLFHRMLSGYAMHKMSMVFYLVESFYAIRDGKASHLRVSDLSKNKPKKIQAVG